jgi:hypothetical protein
MRNLVSAPNIIRMIKSMKRRLEGRVAHMGKWNEHRNLVGNPE